MAGLEHVRSHGGPDDGGDAGPDKVGAAQQHAATRGADLDDVLAEIDGVLETNAEEFVSGFVQKGGQ